MLPQLDCVLGVGANLGERERTFAWVLEQLAKLGQVTAISHVYENPAVGGPKQPDYLNAAIRLETPLSPLGLLEATQHLERMAGRERDVHWGPRTLDLDLLWIPDQILELPTLQVPHPRLVDRAFALLPLVEVAKEAKDPKTQLSYSALLHTRRVDELRLHAIARGPVWHWQRVRSRLTHSATLHVAE